MKVFITEVEEEFIAGFNESGILRRIMRGQINSNKSTRQKRYRFETGNQLVLRETLTFGYKLQAKADFKENYAFKYYQ